MNLSGRIGFFDSGIGGLTVLQTCLNDLKNQLLYYYGDNQHAPYGNLSKEKIQEYVGQAFETFAFLRVQAVVIACNTVTALCIDELRKKYDFSVIGAEPALFPAAKKGGEILVLCTKRTAESNRVQALKERSEKQFPNSRITLHPCPDLAEVIEKSPFLCPRDLSDYLPKRKADAVVLGCTHYIYYKKQIEEFYNCPVFDGNEGIKYQLLRSINHGRYKNEHERPLDEDLKQKSLYSDLQNAYCLRLDDLENISECDIGKNACKSIKNPFNNRLLFIGSGQENNEKVYKQMFAFYKNG